MAGGTWLSQNKGRPGAYINFEAVKKGSMTTGDRGIAAIGLSLPWGKEAELTEVLSIDMLDGNSQKKVGVTAFDAEAKLLSGALSYCYKALVFRMNTGGLKSKAVIGNLSVEAKYSGTLGNEINVAVSKAEEGIFKVVTYVKGSSVDVQKVSSIAELEPNDYAVFSKVAEPEGEDFTESAGTPLAGGTDGAAVPESAYPAMFKLLKKAKWQILACLSDDVSIKKSTLDFIKGLRDDEGRYVQAVVADYDGADYEGIINSVSGAVIDGVEFLKTDFVAIVAGMTAGANFNESNTARTVTGATSIIGELDDNEIKKALEKGKFLLSTSASGVIKVEQDINSLHTYTSKNDYSFSKNRVIRTLDEIGTQTKMTWEKTYMGKVDNEEDGRALFRSDLITYAKELQRLHGIQEFDPDTDVSVAQGRELDSVSAEWSIKPVDSMEKLYLLVKVRK